VGSVTGSVDLAGCEWLQYDYGSALMARDRGQVRSPCGDTGSCCRFPTVRCGTRCQSAARRCCPHLPSDRRWARSTCGFKDETRNPSASNKDRATALVIEDGLRRGMGTITTASTGRRGRRMLPAWQMSVRPPLLDESYLNEVVGASDSGAIRYRPSPFGS
jgi:threonine synthase